MQVICESQRYIERQRRRRSQSSKAVANTGQVTSSKRWKKHPHESDRRIGLKLRIGREDCNYCHWKDRTTHHRKGNRHEWRVADREL